MAQRFTIVGIGEALYDIFADKQVLGGAPLNVALHSHQLLSPLGGRGVVVSRVGQDDLGRQLMDDLARRGMTGDFLQTDPDHDTGKAYVQVDSRGQSTFEIADDTAWDWLSFDPEDEVLARTCDAVCFGTLAQRHAQSRNAIYRFLDAAGRAIKLFDVNLRQNFYDARIIRRSLELCTAVKANREELHIMCDLLGIVPSAPAKKGHEEDRLAETLVRKHRLKFLALTRGAAGTVLFLPGNTSADSAQRFEGESVTYPSALGADSCGAGDACAAGLLAGMLLRWPGQKTVDLANHIGAFVASQPGATPVLPAGVLALITG